MLQGIYRDIVHDASGCLVYDSRWSSNCIVDTAWPLLSGLLKNTPDFHGIMYWAVGTGDPVWDSEHIIAECSALRLYNEVARVPVAAEDMTYLNPDGSESEQTTSRLEVNANFSWLNETHILREFGIYGGNASESANSGYLINYVIHPAIELTSGSTLTRRLRFNFKPLGGEKDWLTLPQHWLADYSVETIDGVGASHTASLADSGVTTINALAMIEPAAIEVDIPILLMTHWRAKARLLLMAAADLIPLAALSSWRVPDILSTSNADLAAQLDAVSLERVAHIREQLGAILVALDDSFITKMTYGELTQP